MGNLPAEGAIPPEAGATGREDISHHSLRAVLAAPRPPRRGRLTKLTIIAIKPSLVTWKDPAPPTPEAVIRTPQPRLLTPLALAAALTLTGCGTQDRPAEADGRIPVVASTDVYGSIVAAVGGERVQVTSLIDNSRADPAAYDSTPSDAVAVSRARLVIGNGGGYDDFIFRLTDAAGGDRTVLDVSDVSGLKDHVPSGGEFNEHVWFDLAAMQRLGDRIAEDLIAQDPSGAAIYRAGAGRFRTEVEALRTQVAELAGAANRARVAVTEPLPLYLVEQAGLVNATSKEFMEASEEGTDAPAAVVQRTLALVTGSNPVRALLLNAQTQTPATDRLRAAAASAGVPEVQVFENIGDPTEGYVTWMKAQIEALVRALEPTP